MHNAEAEARELRERVETLLARLERLDSAGPNRMLQRAVVVYAKTAVPTSTGVFFATHPLKIQGAETEGAGATVATDTSTTLYVLVTGTRVPVAGTVLHAKNVPYRWVATKKGSGSGGGCRGSICVYYRNDCPLGTTNPLLPCPSTITKDGSPFGVTTTLNACASLNATGTYVITPTIATVEGPQTVVITDPCQNAEVDFTRSTVPAGYQVVVSVGGCFGRTARDILLEIPEAGYSATLATVFFEAITLPGPGTYTVKASRADGRYIPGSTTFTVDKCNPGATVSLTLSPVAWAVCVSYLGNEPISRQLKITDPLNGVAGLIATWADATADWRGSGSGTIPACAPCASAVVTIHYVTTGTSVFPSYTIDPVTNCPALEPAPVWDPPAVVAFNPLHYVINYLFCPNNVATGTNEYPVTIDEVLP